MKRELRLLGAVVAAWWFVVSVSAAEVGAAAPDFSLVDTDGRTHSLSEYSGQIVVLEWTNYGCPYVKRHYGSGNMQAVQESAKGQGVVWLSVCSSPPGAQGHMPVSEWKAAIASKGVNASAVLLDESGEVGQLYGAIVTPHLFVIDASGVLVYDGAIDNNPSLRGDIAQAENYVTAAVDALLAGEPIERPKVRPYGCGIKYARP